METSERPPASQRERILELGAVLLMSLAAVATAWSGYQAARWSGEQAQGYAKASATRIKSQQAATHSGQVRIDDLLYFNGWLNAHETGNRQLAAIYLRRFRRSSSPRCCSSPGSRCGSTGAGCGSLSSSSQGRCCSAGLTFVVTLPID